MSVLLASITQAAYQQHNPLLDEEDGEVNVSSIAPIIQNPPSMKYVVATFVIPVATDSTPAYGLPCPLSN